MVCHLAQDKMIRFILFTIASLLQMNSILVHNQVAYEVDLTQAVKDKALFGCAFFNLTQATILDCFEHCLKNCVCLAFQMCQNPECQLLASTRDLTPSELRLKVGCTYYELLPRREIKGINEQVSKCASGVNCCEMSKPCLNGGRCELSNHKDYPMRFKCKCPDKYGGRRCETCALGYAGDSCQTCAKGFTGKCCEMCEELHVGNTCKPIRSCRSYKYTNQTSGIYKILDANSNISNVYCDFNKNSSMSWTLISSYKFAVHEDPNIKWSFAKDKPTDEDNPNWNKYRLSKSRMESIQQDSTKWRITCDYQSTGVIFEDYVRASNDKVDILTYNGIGCVHVEYINIRGQHCSDCTAYMAQSHNREVYQWYTPLHFHSYSTNACDFKPTGGLPCGGQEEDNFGFYDCPNPAHRCSATENSTTQIWFGGD